MNEEKVKIEFFRRWLSDHENDQWLLTFDNYDDPHLPGIRSPTGCTKLGFGKQLRMQKLEDVVTGVAILSQRSGQDLSNNSTATDLAKRLDGLPLALATAGTCLRRTGISCHEYHDLYHSAWKELVGADTEELYEYEARTLASTWTISLDQVKRQDDDAAELLTFFAYLSNCDIWYELIKAGATGAIPGIHRVTENKVRFQRAMSRLRDYNLVEVAAGSHQVHPCLHDWLMEHINTQPNSLMFVAALMCVASSIDHQSTPPFCIANRRLLVHTEQLESLWSRNIWDLSVSSERVLAAAHSIAGLQREWDRFDAAELMYKRALAGREEVLGPDHILTLNTINNLGLVYRDQGRLVDAEKVFIQVLARKEKALGVDHISTLVAINNLGRLYRDQGKLEAAEQLFIRALVGREKIFGPGHTSTLRTVNNLGLLYHDQGKLDDAEETLKRALVGKEKVYGPDHESTLNTVHILGRLYHDQGKLDAAEQLFIRVLAGREKLHGSDHTSTLSTVNSLGLVYGDQGNLDAAKQMCNRALACSAKVLRPDHAFTPQTVNNLATHPRAR